MASDLLGGGQFAQGSGTNTATATLTVPAGRRGYLLCCSVEVVAGTATLCRLQVQSAGSPNYAVTFPVQAAATACGGQIVFPTFIPMTGVNQDLTVVATTTGATSTNVYMVAQLGP